MRTAREIPGQKPRWAFFKGLLTGAAIEIPLIAATVWLVARLGIGNPDVGFMPVMRLAAVFTGVAALLTAGGIGRLAAYTSVEKGRRHGILVATRTHAVATAALVVIAAIPHGHIDFKDFSWLMLPITGLLAGAFCGAVIGTVCTAATSVGLADVWSATMKPTEALRSLLSPGDLVRLGSALRTRTSAMFEGIFDPAPKRPAEPKPAEPPKPDASEPVGDDTKKAV
ncbi:MAG: hypothetical protein M4D80_37050 [Myxococcota bacterium]|nr:hypothetical protein [Myxococcota bacterium]